MNTKAIILFAVAAFLFSCNANNKKEPATDTDVATAFIRATLDNDLKEAERFILKDDTNHQYFQTFKRQYQQKDKASLEKYKTAEVEIYDLNAANDSVHIVTYSNTYTNQKNKLKLIWLNGKWFVDFKYTVTENAQQ